MNSDPRTLLDRVHELVVIAVLTGIVVVLLVQSFELRESAGLVPRIVLIPLLGALGAILVATLIRFAASRREPVPQNRGSSEPSDHPALQDSGYVETGGVDDFAAQLRGVDLRSLGGFGLWAIATVVFCGAVGFGLGAPISLAAILLVSSRRLVRSLAIAAAFGVFTWLVFGVLLGVRLYPW